jgi:hypothetical protein
MVNRLHHDDPTAGGTQLPSLPKLYQNIFKSLGMNGPPTQADPSTIVPPQGMQDFYNEAFRVMGFPPSPRNPNRIQRYPDHTGAAQLGYGPYGRISPPNENYGVGLDFSGYSPTNAAKINTNINQTYGSRGYGSGPYASSQQYPDQQIFSDQPSVGDDSTMPVYPQRQSRPPMYTPPGVDIPMPSFMRNRATVSPATAPARQEPTDSLQRTLLGLDTEGDTGHDSTASTMQAADPRVIRALDRNAGPRVLPNAAVYQATPGENRIENMIPSTGRAHLTAPIYPSSANVPLPIPRPDDLSSTPQAQPKALPQPKPPLHNVTPDANQQQDEDTGPGSLAEAKRLFPGQKLQQAVYYTQPDRGENGGGNFKRLGVGADTSNLNPDYVSHIWEPVNMNTTQRFVRGAYETPGPSPITYDPNSQQDDQQMASGGAIDAAHKISREKATPCHTGLINMAVGGRTDHLPMHVREGSYVLPADIVSALGEGNTMAGSKVVDHMFAGKPAHKASGGTTIGISQKPQFLQSSRTLPGDVELGVNGQDTAGSALLGNMFNSGPFGTSAKAPQFAPVVRPSLGQYGQMSQLFNSSDKNTFSNKKEASGGPIMSGNRRPVPIIAAGGEYVIDPDDVSRYGGGDINKGHDKLDEFVKHVRKHLVKTLSKLPPPRRD